MLVPFGEHIVTASEDGSVRLWDSKAGAHLLTMKGNMKGLLSASISHDGHHLVTAGGDGSVLLWDVQTGGFLYNFSGHMKAVRMVNFSANAKQLVTASDDGTVRIWDTGTGLLLMTFASHQSGMNAASFSPAGEQMVAVGEAGVGYIYSVKLDFYVKRACELLRRHRQPFQDVADVCKRVGVLPVDPLPTGVPMSQAERIGGAG
jgi:WD40 repeat protein